MDMTLLGGIERFVSEISFMICQGHEVEIFSLHRSNSQPFYPLPRTVKLTYLNSFPFGSLYKLTSLLAIIAGVRLFAFKDLLISTSPIISIIIGSMPSLRTRLIASEHSSIRAHGLLIRFFRILVYRNIFGCVTQTRLASRYYGIMGVATSVIPNPVPIFEDSAQWVAKAKFSSPIKFLTVSRLEAVKQIDHMIYVINRLNESGLDCQLHIVGSGSEMNRLMTISQSMLFSEAIFFHGASPNVSHFYQLCDFYLVTSESEAYPMAMIEALSFGLPVFSYPLLEGPSALVSPGINGFFSDSSQWQSMYQLIDYSLRACVDDPGFHGLSLSAISSVAHCRASVVGASWKCLLQ